MGTCDCETKVWSVITKAKEGMQNLEKDQSGAYNNFLTKRV